MIYHTGYNPRPSHAALDGNIYAKTDPFLKTHWPPWDYNCNCYLEECTAKKANCSPGKIQPPAEPGEATVTSRWVFDPANGFENNASGMEPVRRESILAELQAAVRDGALDDIGVIVQNPRPNVLPIPLPGSMLVREALQQCKSAATDFLRTCGAMPGNDEQYKELNHEIQNYAHKALGITKDNAKMFARRIPDNVRDKIPGKEILVGTLYPDAAQAAGLEDRLPVTLEKGAGAFGLSHMWINHKHLFLNPAKADLTLQETLGSPGCRVVVNLKQQRYVSRGDARIVCSKKFVLQNPKAGAYLVLRLATDEKKLQIVSFHRASTSYGNKQWAMQ